jgi:putative phage-type endonuclease
LRVLKSKKNMSLPEWLQIRTQGIGGSDASIILGLNKFKSPFQLYMEKVENNLEQEDSEVMYWGRTLEEVIAKEFETRTGKKVRRVNQVLQHDTIDYMIANIDRKVVGEDAILECKTTSAYNYKEWLDNEVPEAYIIQVQHYMAVTGDKKAYVACLIGGNKFVIKEVERDDELIDIIIKAEKTFWEEHVLKRIPPALDGSSAAEEYLKAKYPESDPSKIIDLGKADEDNIIRLLDLKAREKELKEQITTLENAIKNELKDAEIGLVNKYQVTWKTVSSNRVDTDKLKSEYPDIYKNVIKTSVSRRFNIKEVI